MSSPALLLEALAFASIKHRDQRRKGSDASPYINHPIAVAAVLASEGEVTDDVLLAAAALHDTIEDTKTTLEELAHAFGKPVAAVVADVTDDKLLDAADRKRLQVEHAAHLSAGAKQLKIADKICNIRDVATHPPLDWSLERRREYLAWASSVVDGCRGVNPRLELAFDDALASARRVLDATSE